MVSRHIYLPAFWFLVISIRVHKPYYLAVLHDCKDIIDSLADLYSLKLYNLGAKVNSFNYLRVKDIIDEEDLIVSDHEGGAYHHLSTVEVHIKDSPQLEHLLERIDMQILLINDLFLIEPYLTMTVQVHSVNHIALRLFLFQIVLVEINLYIVKLLKLGLERLSLILN